ncbi:p5 [Emaravirus cercidis]|uniref:p5 n=1 Tax=Emaravirus cercidis TaxID=1980432 RepID=A0A191W095_9VIRU|nr:p5 [Emaravirus cercidis]ANJ21384.1 p5 [Emaravirus cercidis]
MKMFDSYTQAYHCMFGAIFNMIQELFPQNRYANCIILNEYLRSGSKHYSDLFIESQHLVLGEDKIDLGSVKFYRKIYMIINMILGHLEPLFFVHGGLFEGLLIEDQSMHLTLGSQFVRNVFDNVINQKYNFQLAFKFALKNETADIMSDTFAFEFYSKSIMFLQLKHISKITSSYNRGKQLLRSDSIDGESHVQDEDIDKILLGSPSASTRGLNRQVSIISIN